MKKKVTSAIFILVGAGLWMGLAHTARFSIKKWDAKFESVMRHTLQDLGVRQSDILASVHEIRKDERGEWVVHRLTIEELSGASLADLKDRMETTGAAVAERREKSQRILLIKRGGRVYQEIRIKKILS